jgi:NADPH:quinone reductase-like Zn-dependent oxidoreductase
MFESMNKAIGFAGLRPVVDRVFDYAQALDAFEHMQKGAHFGKIVVRVG